MNWLPRYPIFHLQERVNESIRHTIINSSSINTIQSHALNFDLNIVLCATIAGLVVLILALVATLLFLRTRLQAIQHHRPIYNQPFELDAEEMTSVNNPNPDVPHSDAVLHLIALMFPWQVQHRNVTALRQHHKDQRSALKSYQGEEEREFKEASDRNQSALIQNV